MKKFCRPLREHAPNVISFEKKKMLPLTKIELKLHQDARHVIFVKKVPKNVY